MDTNTHLQEYTLMLGDCLELLPSVASGSVDLICADLPYGTTSCAWDTIIPFAPLWDQYRRVLKPNGIVLLTAAQPFTTVLNMSNLPGYKYEWVWDKIRGVGHLNAKKKPLQRHETVSVFSDVSLGRCTYNPQMRKGRTRRKGSLGQEGGCYGHISPVDYYSSDEYYPSSILEYGNSDLVNRLHPTQKPVQLMEYLIRTYSNEGETVLDNCFGSGTTGVAAINARRRFVGIEKGEAYFAAASKRIARAIAVRDNETGLFGI